jgi:hypothetical protein
MQSKQQIIRSRLKQKVEQARSGNKMYQRFHGKLRYDLHDNHLVQYNSEELSQFGKLEANHTSRPERT